MDGKPTKKNQIILALTFSIRYILMKQTELSRLENLQYRAAKLVTGTSHLALTWNRFWKIVPGWRYGFQNISTFRKTGKKDLKNFNEGFKRNSKFKFDIRKGVVSCHLQCAMRVETILNDHENGWNLGYWTKISCRRRWK